MTEDLVFSPYNPLNKEITKYEIEEILKKYNIPSTIHNIHLYKRAFIHKSYLKNPDLENKSLNVTIEPCPKDCIPLKTKSNERLEFLGDGVLECVTKYYLYKRFPKENEGFMTEKKIALVKNEHIGKLAYEIGLHKWFIISKHAEEKNIRTNYKRLGCLFEAFIGALFLDFNKIQIHDEDKWFNHVFSTGPGFQMAQIFIENIFEKHVNWIELIRTDDNYKNILQVKIQQEFKVTPTYLIIDLNDEGVYTMGVYLCLHIPSHIQNPKDAEIWSDHISIQDIHAVLNEKNRIFLQLGTGQHKIKKKAEQLASEQAIQRLV